MRFYSARPTLAVLACTVALSLPTLAHALKHKTEDESPILQKTIHRSEIMVPQADQVLQEISRLNWRPLPDGEGLSLKTLLESTEDNNPKMLLEGESSANRQFHLQQALYDNTQAYLGLIKQWMAQAAIYQQLRLQQKELLSNVNAFEQGQVNSIPVLKSQAELIAQYQLLKATQDSYEKLSQTMAVNAGLDTSLNYAPKALEFDNDRYRLSLPDVKAPDWLDAKLTGQVAKEARPEVKQAEAARDEFRMKFLGLSTITPTGAARIKDLEHLVKQSEEAAQGVAQQSLKKIPAANNSVNRALANLELTEKAHYQAKISFDSGFSSEKDVLEVTAILAKAQAGYVNALADAYLANITLLRDMGLLSSKTALQGLDKKTTQAIAKRKTIGWLTPHPKEETGNDKPADETSTQDTGKDENTSEISAPVTTAPIEGESEKTAPEATPQNGLFPEKQ